MSDTQNRPWLAPVTLENDAVRLTPLALEHERGLIAAASDENLWNGRPPKRILPLC